MKTILTLTFILVTVFSNTTYSQDFSTLEKALLKEFPDKSGSTDNGAWVFYKEKGNIKKINRPNLDTYLPKYTVYNVNFTNYLGHHVNKWTCYVLFNEILSKPILITPIWYSGIPTEPIKMVINKTFSSKEDQLEALKEIHELMTLNSDYKLIETSHTEKMILFDFVYYNNNSQKNIRKIKVIINEEKIEKYFITDTSSEESTVVIEREK